ncbi:RDD family protein [Streptomyces sp. JNUCC 64]
MSAPTPAPGEETPREGYYPDPSIPGYVRYWNGAAWVPGTSRPAPVGGAAPAVATGPAAPAAGPPPLSAPPVEETGPVFFDEEPSAPAAAHPEPAPSWGPGPAHRGPAHQGPGYGDQERKVSWGAPDPSVPDPRTAPPAPATPTAPTVPAASAFPAAPGQGVGDPAAPAPADRGTVTFPRAPRTGTAPAPVPHQQTTPPAAPAAPAPRTSPEAAPFPSAGAPPHPAAPRPPALPAATTAPAPGPRAPEPGAPGHRPPNPGAPGPRTPEPPARAAVPAPAAPAPLPEQPSWAQQVHRLAQPPAASAPQPAATGPGGPGGPGAPGEGGPVIPWKPPVTDPFLAAAQAQAASRPAGLGRRLVARLLDTAVIALVTGAAAVPLGIRAVDHLDDKIEAARLSGRTVTVWLLDGTTGVYLGVVLAVLLLAGIVYEVLPTAKWGRTLGKRLCGVRVEDIEGHEPPSFGAALRRFLVFTMPGLLLIGAVGALWAVFDRPWRQGWHDKAARTFVAR